MSSPWVSASTNAVVLRSTWRFAIDLFHNGGPIKYSFVLMLLGLSSLAAMRKIQKNMLTKMRPIGPININTIEYQIGCHLWKWSISPL